MAVQFLANANGWHSYNPSTPRLYITAETEDFDEETMQAWKNEGFQVGYIPLTNGRKAYINKLKSLEDSMTIGQRYAIIAYGEAGSVTLEHFSDMASASSKLCALIAYYPNSIPSINTRFSATFRVLVHLAGGMIGVTRNHHVLGIQGKRQTVQKRITRGVGAGGLQPKINYPSYTYEAVEPGFAEHDLDEYDKIAAEIAWTRSLDVVRRAFVAEIEMEKIVDAAEEYKFKDKNAEELVNTMTDLYTPHANYGPTMAGGIGKEELLRFYKEFFIPSTPPSFRMRLLSRTIGVDRVVDEIFIAFKHSQAVPWMLPGIPPTDKKVEVVIVSIACLKAGRLYSEHVYWDQASVLYQLGLFDPEYVPDEMREKGVEMLPVAGSESARKMADEESEPSNEMLDEW